MISDCLNDRGLNVKTTISYINAAFAGGCLPCAANCLTITQVKCLENTF